MSPKDALRLSIGMSDYIVDAYIKDLDDADLLIRPVPGHEPHRLAAWPPDLVRAPVHRDGQAWFVPSVAGRFRRVHTKETISIDDPSKFYSRSQYQDLWKKQRERDSGRTRRDPRIRARQERPREIPRMGADRRRPPGHERHSRADALRPVGRRPPPAWETGGDLTLGLSRSDCP